MRPMNSDEIRQLANRFPRINLGLLPTPLHEASNLSRALGARVWIKRDDLTGLGFGGNKVRKLEFLMADARASGADNIILSAAAQSNMVRMTAAAAARLGMEAHLVLRSVVDPEPIQGNLLLDHLFGAKVTFIRTHDPYSQLSVDVMQGIAQELQKQGKTPYVIDLRYHSAALAALSYVLAAAELQVQIRTLGIEASHLFVPTGSGNTQVGLLVGSSLLDSEYQVVGVSVQKPNDFICPKIAEKVEGVLDLMGMDTVSSVRPISVDDRWIGSEYGVPSPEGVEAIKLLARTEGIVLDPVYSGKAMAGLVGWAREGRFSEGDRIIFLHTGGTPALFALADQLAPKFSD